MTTHDAVRHKDPDAFKALMQDPALRAAAAAAADELMAQMQASWPEDASEPTMDGVSAVFERKSYTMADGRPAEWIMINHPMAAVKQAETRFITRAVAESGYDFSS